MKTFSPPFRKSAPAGAWAVAAAIATTLAATPAAQAATFVEDGVDGSFTSLFSVQPGEYGFEARRGDSGGFATWELGVGTQTSNTGTFNEANFDWGTTPHPFEMTWTPGSEVSVTVGSTTLSYAADWLVGNAIRILAVRSSQLDITSLNGVSLVDTVGQIGSSTADVAYIAGDELLSGWTLAGNLQLTGGDTNVGSALNDLRITSGNFEPTPPETVPEPGAVLGLLAIAGVSLGLGLKRQGTHSTT